MFTVENNLREDVNNHISVSQIKVYKQKNVKNITLKMCNYKVLTKSEYLCLLVNKNKKNPFGLTKPKRFTKFDFNSDKYRKYIYFEIVFV